LSESAAECRLLSCLPIREVEAKREDLE